jgi:hypothetical protein
MAYCRFSSDDWRCDVYCYASVSGAWVTHVATNRHVGELPHVNSWPRFLAGELTAQEFCVLHAEQMRFLETAPRVRIELPHAGETFDDAGPAEMHERLTQLRALGYHVPGYVFAELAAEATEHKP